MVWFYVQRMEKHKIPKISHEVLTWGGGGIQGDQEIDGGAGTGNKLIFDRNLKDWEGRLYRLHSHSVAIFHAT
jgi:hypothetical protein